MRLITHTDLDGVISAVLICSVEQVDEIKFVDPATIESGLMKIGKFDIMADLPRDRRAGLWFDHHESSAPQPGEKFEGAHSLAPSAARVIYDYYENPYLDKYKEALEAVDKIDSGKVPLEWVRNPTGWFLFSNTLETDAPKEEDDDYRRYAIALIRKSPGIETVLSDPEVAERAERVQSMFEGFSEVLRANTKMLGKVAFSDLREAEGMTRGNNYIVYSLFPMSVASVRLSTADTDKGTVKISVGHNVYGKKSTFDIGAAMRKIGGGGHRAVGGANVKKEEADSIAKKLIEEINAWVD
jgi:uncharacterized UPF0160 family protein